MPLLLALRAKALLILPESQNMNAAEKSILSILDEDLERLLPASIQHQMIKKKMTLIVQDLQKESKIAQWKAPFLGFGATQLLIDKNTVHTLSELPHQGREIPLSHLLPHSHSSLTKHKTYYTYVRASLIHTIGAFYDDTAEKPLELKQKIAKCLQEASTESGITSDSNSEFIKPHVRYIYKNQECQRLVSIKRAISGHYLFLNAAGFPEQGFYDELNSRQQSNFLYSMVGGNSSRFFFDPKSLFWFFNCSSIRRRPSDNRLRSYCLSRESSRRRKDERSDIFSFLLR